MTLHRKIESLLATGLEAGEARAQMLLLLDHLGGLTTADVLAGKDELLDPSVQAKLLEAAQRVAQGEPVQQVVGWTEFCGLRIAVTPDVLIPRPETEELVEWIVEREAWSVNSEEKNDGRIKILDIGTGSGCIALTLKHVRPQSDVTAVDVSEPALAVARENSVQTRLDIRLEQVNILTELPSDGPYDIVVSNPPYIPQSEQAEMDGRVLHHEPHEALFVSDDNPLTFYHAIGQKAQKLLTQGGRLYLEINRRYGPAVTELLRRLGYEDVELRQDQFGNDRMVRACHQQASRPTWNEN